jgi:hypothetical protein
LLTILAHEVRIYRLVKRLIEAQMNPPSSWFEVMEPVAPEVQTPTPNKSQVHK